MKNSPMTPGADRQRRFHMRDCLGRGGFGEVYLATMVSPGGLKSDVAVKLLRDANPDALRRLRDEGKLLAALNHPAILRALDLAGLDGNVALVTEYVDGADLNDLTDPSGRPLPPRAVLEVIAVVAEALHVAFTTVPNDGIAPMRLVHRDVKPSNIRVGRHGEVKLLDFGIAWAAVAGREAQTNATAMMGSLPYMAPERFARSAAHPASDVYALGCTTYEALKGERLFPDASPLDMARMAASPELHDAHVRDALALLPPDGQVAVPLLVEMLAYEAGERPEAVDVAARCDELADRAAGARLKQWARSFDWGAARSGGPLSGQTLTEQTLSMLSGRSSDFSNPAGESSVDRTIDLGLSGSWGSTFDVSDTVPAEDVPTARRSPWLALLAVPLLLGAVWWLVPTEGGVASPEPAMASPEPALVQPEPAPPVIVAEPAPPVIVAEPAGVPEPAVVAPRPRPRPAPKPIVAPEPVVVAPVPAPKLVPIAKGTVLAPPGVRIVLRDGSGVDRGPGEVPAGKYDIWADFNDDFGIGLSAVGKADVIAGAVVRIQCNGLRFTCEPVY